MESFSNIILYSHTGPFRIKNKKSGDCIAVQDPKPGHSLVMGSCDESRSAWTYTLTGQLMVSDRSFISLGLLR